MTKGRWGRKIERNNCRFFTNYLFNYPLPRSGGGAGGAEPSAASGGCSEAEHPQRSKKSSKRAARRFFRAPQGGGGRCACGYLGSVSVRSTDDASASFVSSTASDRKGFVKGESVPLDPLLPPFGGAKGGPRRVGVLTKPCKSLRDDDRRDEMIALIFAVNPSVSLAADSLSLRLGHGAALICHRHIIHYRAATSLPLTQGRLWVGAPLTLCISL